MTDTREAELMDLDVNKPRGLRLVFNKLQNILTAFCHKIRWGLRFQEFGWCSRLYGCDMLTNPKAIRIGKRVLIRKGARLEAVGPWDGHTPKITIGDDTAAQFYFHCAAAESVKIGKDVLIAGRVFITDHDHYFGNNGLPPVRSKELRVKPVTIKDGCWLGEGCVVLKGVTINERAVVGANAVVTKDVPAEAIVGGVPAKVIGKVGMDKSFSRLRIAGSEAQG